MSNQESSSMLAELESTPAKVGPTGTTHILTVVVDMMKNSAIVSDPSLRIRNGDTVIECLRRLSDRSAGHHRLRAGGSRWDPGALSTRPRNSGSLRRESKAGRRKK
jgi:hypothetical protein